MRNFNRSFWTKIKHSLNVYYNNACIDIECSGKRFMWSRKKAVCDKCGRSDMEGYQEFSWNTLFLIVIIGVLLLIKHLS